MNRIPEQNEVFLNGNLTKDPEVRYTNAGTAMCRFRLGVNRRYKDAKTGEFKDDSTFVNVVVWRDAAEQCGRLLKKGSPVHIEGRLRSYEYEDKRTAGQKRSGIEVEARKVQILEKSQSSEGIGGGPADSPADVEEVSN